MIVSKDSDFRQFGFLHGPPPKEAPVRRTRVVIRDVVSSSSLHDQPTAATGQAEEVVVRR